MIKSFTKEKLCEELGFDEFTIAEQRFWTHNFEYPLQFDDGQGVPESAEGNNTLRAEFLKAVFLHKIEGVDIDPSGFEVRGAWIDGELDLSYSGIPFPFRFVLCKFEKYVDISYAKILEFILSGSELAKLEANGVNVERSVQLDGVRANGIVLFRGAKIQGQFCARTTRFLGQDYFSADGEGYSLSLHEAEIKHHVFLQMIDARGTVELASAKFGDQLILTGAKIENCLQLHNTEIKTDLTLRAININEVYQIMGNEYCRANLERYEINPFEESNRQTQIPALHMYVLKVNSIIDDEASWPENGRLILDNARYNVFLGSEQSANARLRWLDLNHKFVPQIYRQLASVFRREGQSNDAYEVLYVMEKKLAEERKKSRPILEDVGGWEWLRFRIRIAFDWLYGFTTGYGFRLYRALACLLALMLWIGMISFIGYHWDQMVPNSGVILSSSEWTSSIGARDWINNTPTGRDWQSFSAPAYAVDVVLPIVDLGQESAWSPSLARGKIAFILFHSHWITKLLGWIIVTFALAATANNLQSRHQD